MSNGSLRCAGGMIVRAQWNEYPVPMQKYHLLAYRSDKRDYVNSPDLGESPWGRDWAEIGSRLAVVGLDWPPWRRVLGA